MRRWYNSWTATGWSAPTTTITREAQGAETRSTFYMYRKQERGFHIDHCFVPRAWAPYLKSVQVGAYADWRHLSDHCPMVIEFDFRRTDGPLLHRIRDRMGAYLDRFTRRESDRLITRTLTVPGRRDRITVDPRGIRSLARLLPSMLRNRKSWRACGRRSDYERACSCRHLLRRWGPHARLRARGLQCVAGFDADENCRFPFEHNNQPAKFVCRRIEHITVSEIRLLYPKDTIRILVGCAPCQPFSKYTKKRLDRMGKWQLVERFADLICEVDPDIISMENVPSLVSYQDGLIYSSFVKKLTDHGYHVTPYPTVYCPDYGVPQRRTRLVLFASKFGKIELAPATHTPKQYATVRSTIEHLPKIAAGEKCITDPLHKAAGLSELNLRRIQASRPGGTWRDWDKALIPECFLKESGTGYVSSIRAGARSSTTAGSTWATMQSASSREGRVRPQARAADRGPRHRGQHRLPRPRRVHGRQRDVRRRPQHPRRAVHVPGHRCRSPVQDDARPRRRGREDLDPRRADEGHPDRRHRLQHVLRRRGADRRRRHRRGRPAARDAGERGHAAVSGHRPEPVSSAAARGAQ